MATPLSSPKHVRGHRPEPLFWPLLKISQRRPAAGAPENTFPLFGLALQEGAEGIAIDVHLSADGVPVVIGDARFSLIPSRIGPMQKHQVNPLLDFDAGVRSNRQIPSPARRQHAPMTARLLSEVFRWVREQRCMVFVVLDNPAPGTEAKILKEINRAKVRHLTRVIAGNMPGLRRLRQLDADVHLGLRFAVRPPPISHAKALGAEVLLPHWEAVSDSFIRRAHRAAMLVIPWTVDSPRQMRRTILNGVDGIITNYPAKLTETAARLQKTRRSLTS